jgi:flagellar hook-basal body complex protein FliE
MAIEKIGMLPVANVGGSFKPQTVGANGDFASMLQEFAVKSIDAGAQGETLSLKAVDKKADLVDIVTAISNAEVTLDTVVTMRDRVIAAYQEISRMPV